jgi:phosphatidylglycerophosphate synthase
LACVANVLTAARAALAPVIVGLAVAGQGRLVAGALILGGVTDFIDGHASRRTGHNSAEGARFDATADLLVLGAGAIALLLLHPALLTHSAVWLGVTVSLYALSQLAGPEQPRTSAKIAGAALYGFALITFVSGDAEPLLLQAALLALAVSAVERIVAAAKTIQPIASASRALCHAPQAWKEVARSAGDETNSPSSSAPTNREIRP